MGKPLSIFKATTGLNKKQDEVSLEYNPESGLTELSEALNVDIDDKGKVLRRPGFVSVNSNPWHSLKGFGDFGLGVSGDSLFIIHPDSTVTGIRSGLTLDRRMSYIQVNKRIFYCNGIENGVVLDGSSWTWVSNIYPTTPGIKYDMRYLSSAPIGSHVSYLSGRVYVARGNTLFFSLPWSYYWFNTGQDFIPFTGEINMLCPTNSGMFIGTGNELVFMRGLNPLESSIEFIDSGKAVTWSNVEIDVKRLPQGFEHSGKTWMWMSDKGICLGSGSGVFDNLTMDRIDIEFAQEGAGLYDGSKYVGLLNP